MFQQIVRPIRTVKLLAALTAAAFLVVGLLTLDMGGSSSVDVQIGCNMVPAVSHGAHGAAHGTLKVCPMKVGEHLAWWQSTFTGIPSGSSALAMLALLATLLVATLIFAPVDSKSLLPARSVPGSKDPPDKRLHDYFALFLAEGLAQPLLYA
jgi:hypothetical protein